MNTLPKELISGIAKLDELTLLIHDSKTQLEVIPFLSELRDRRLVNYEPYSNYYKQHAERLFNNEKRGDMPTFKDNEVLVLNHRYDLVLADWQHITYKDKTFQIIYIKDKETGEFHFRDMDQFTVRSIYDKKIFKWVNDSDKKMCCNDYETTTLLVWSLREIAVSNQCKPGNFFYDVKKDITNLNQYYGYAKQKELLLNILID